MEDVAKHPRLMRRGTVYWFRAKVPTDLVMEFAPKKEITFSLKTKDHKEALQLVRVESVKLDQQFTALRAKKAIAPRTTISPAEIERLAALHYHTMLEEDEEFRMFGSGDDEVISNISKQPEGVGYTQQWSQEELHAESGLSDREFSKSVETTAFVLEEARKRLAKGDTSLLAFEIDELLESNSLQIDRKSPQYRTLSLAILKAHVRALEAIQAREEGRVIDTPPSPVSVAIEPSQPLKDDCPKLSEAFEKWKAERSGPAKTATEFKAQIDRFISLIGDLPIDQITKAHIRAFKDAMLQYPSRPLPHIRKLPVAEVIKSFKGQDIVRLSPKTVNEKCLASLAAVLSYCVNQAGYLEYNPCDGIRAKGDGGTTKQVLIYTDAEIATILAFPIFIENERPIGGGGEAAKWLPLLAMFTGARLEELARLTLADIGSEDSIRYLFIRAGADGKRVKNKSSVRKVPIHSSLIKMGFLEYINTIGHDPSLTIFPDLKSQREKLSAAWSQWWGRYSRDHGISNDGKVFHSFRHTVKRKLRDAKVDKTLRDAIMGHKSADVAESYGLDEDGQGVALHVLSTDAIEKIRYPAIQ